MRPIYTLLAIGLFVLPVPKGHAQVPDKYKPAVNKGLEWLVKQQNADGSWSLQGNQYSVSMTAFAGLALLMEGSTTAKGDHAQRLRKAGDWVVKHIGDSGRIDTQDPNDGHRYIFGQGYGMLFLASLYAEEDNRERRLAMKAALQRSVRFAVEAQSTSGGWYYTSSKEGGNNDEGATTQAQLQGLRAAHAAGIPVPKDTLKKALKYLADNTSPKGGVYYSSRSRGQDRTPLTAGAIVSAYNPGQYDTDVVKKWLKFCHENIPLTTFARAGHDEYTHFYLAQAVFALGEKGYERLFPNQQTHLRWSKYREAYFDQAMRTQNADGSWNSGSWGVGPLYSTSIQLIILQMDNEAVPMLSCKGE